MTRDEAAQYAAWWADAWNRLDIEAVLATFDEEVEIDGEAKQVSENWRFGRDGKVLSAEVFHGAAARLSMR